MEKIAHQDIIENVPILLPIQASPYQVQHPDLEEHHVTLYHNQKVIYDKLTKLEGIMKGLMKAVAKQNNR